MDTNDAGKKKFHYDASSQAQSDSSPSASLSDPAAVTFAESSPTRSTNLQGKTTRDKTVPIKKIRKLWISGICAIILIVLMLCFVLQNIHETQMAFFFWELNFPLGIGMLLSAVIGALITELISVIRIFTLRKKHKD